METVKLAVEARPDSGKGVARRLRAEGRVPGVVYGGGDSHPVSFELSAVRVALAHGTHVLLELHYPKEGRGLKHLTVIKELQRHPTSGALLHVDLQEVRRGEEIEAPVAIELVGVPAGVHAGGLLEQTLHQAILRGQPTGLPASIEVDVSALEIGDHILLSDIVLPKGCAIVGDPDQMLVTILAPRVSAEVTEAPETVEIEEPTE
jgi:large subunit ribosomal protein L25